MQPKRIVIMGAGGKDFHVFSVLFRDDPAVEVVAFTATQIPGIDRRTLPAAFTGPRYPWGIPIVPERELADWIRNHGIAEVIFAYSDVSDAYVAQREAEVRAAGAAFTLPDPRSMMLRSARPVVAVCAVRTGAGKSPLSRYAVRRLRDHGRGVVVVRHPMPYGDLEQQLVQRFDRLEDLDRHRCTIEEREEYEPHLRGGAVVMAGVDYREILRRAQREADVVLWDGGNNDTPFLEPTLYLCVADALRPGHELSYYPGRLNFEMADVIVINKVDQASPDQVEVVRRNAAVKNPRARIVEARLVLEVDRPDLIRGRRALAVEDGPTLTHGGMEFGAGVLACRMHGASALVDPRPFVVGEVAAVFRQYPRIGALLPAVGYGGAMIADLEATINRSDAEVVVIATPVSLDRLLRLDKPVVRVGYELEQVGGPDLDSILRGV